MPAGGTIGNKGGGRKSARDERLRELVVSKAIGKVVKALTDTKKFDDKEWNRIKEMCLPIVTKDMATKLADNKGNKLDMVIEISKEIADKNKLNAST